MSSDGEAHASKRARTDDGAAEAEKGNASAAASSIFSSVMQRLAGRASSTTAAVPKTQDSTTSKDKAKETFEAALKEAAAAAAAASAKEKSSANESGTADAAEEDDKLDDDGNRILPEDYPEEFVNLVSECVEIEVQNVGSTKPMFTHQVFTRDKYILGYKNVKAKFSYTARWRLLMQVTHEGVMPEVRRKATWEVDKDPLEMARQSGIVPIYGEATSVTEDPEVFATWEREDKELEAAEPGLSGAEVVSATDEVEMLYVPEVYANENRRMLLSRLQAMSFWFIETAQQTDAEDPRWSLYVMRVPSGPLIGFVSVFQFNNPIHKKQPFTWRICQTVVLPPVQYHGIGQRAVKDIYLRAINNDQVYELNVEDPCPAFVRLRDAVELTLCLENGVFKGVSLAEEDDTGALASASLEAIHSSMKVSRRQAQRCYDMYQLFKLEQNENEETMRKYRLQLKRRIFQNNVEGVQALPREDLKRNLHLLYNDLVDQFHGALKRIETNLLDK
mmetsp:Transcript_20374/g.40048  ORF Transcript_20374/g.40048 Transcript_20374/m.40048 type:complete len:504 (+) Transcript_20374:192-1703(+)